MEDGMNYLEKLNPQQYQAVTAGNGQILVLAGPGSGKTRVLTQRILYLMKDMGIRPNEILAVTFTNKAAREMQDRVEDLYGQVCKVICGWAPSMQFVPAFCGEASALPLITISSSWMLMTRFLWSANCERTQSDENCIVLIHCTTKSPVPE